MAGVCDLPEGMYVSPEATRHSMRDPIQSSPIIPSNNTATMRRVLITRIPPDFDEDEAAELLRSVGAGVHFLTQDAKCADFFRGKATIACDLEWMESDLESDSDEDNGSDVNCSLSVAQKRKAHLKETTKKVVNEIVCKVCSVSLRTFHHKGDLKNHMLGHAFIHINHSKYGTRYYCNQCKFQGHGLGSVRHHKKRCSHTPIDRYITSDPNTKDQEFLLETARHFKLCFPGQAPHYTFACKVKQIQKAKGLPEDTCWDKEDKQGKLIQCQECLVQLKTHEKICPDLHLFGHAFSHVNSSFGPRFRCRDCHFTTSYPTYPREHTLEFGHKMVDMCKLPTRSKLIRECARVFTTCFPNHQPPQFFKKSLALVENATLVVDENAALQPEEIKMADPETGVVQCKVCLKHLKRGKSGSQHAQFFFAHTMNHLTGHSRYTCSKCDFVSNSLKGQMEPHRRKMGSDHEIIDGCKDSKQTALLAECSSLFSRCFPNEVPPQWLQRIICSSDNTTEKSMLDGLVECKQCTSFFVVSNLFNHACQHIEDTTGKRFRCNDCEYQTNSVHAKIHHASSSQHTLIDKCKDASNTKFIMTCAKVFEECFPGSKPAPFFANIFSLVTTKASKDQCQMCGKSFANASWKNCFDHATLHLATSYGSRFSCRACPFAHNGTSTAQSHAKSQKSANKHEIIDRFGNVNDKELIVECVRLFTTCFPRQPLNATITDMLKQVDPTKKILKPRHVFQKKL